MLNIKEIKKACEYTVDFKISKDGKSFYLPDGPHELEGLLHESTFSYLPKWELVYYPLFLRKILEGFNLSDNIQIVTFFDGEQWWCFDCGDDIYNLPSTTYNTVEESIEEAIKHIFKIKGEEEDAKNNKSK